MGTLDNDRCYIYATDNVTRLEIPRPTEAHIELVERGTNADGSPRTARKFKLVWTFGQSYGLSEADMLVFTSARPANGKMKIRVALPTAGGALARYADCWAVMSPLFGAERRRGRVYGLTVFFTQVMEI